MGKRRRTAILPTNIVLLQNVVRRDPESYHEEFLQQYSHYESLRDIFLMNPGSDDGTEFAELIGFVSAVCNYYPKETKEFPSELRSILSNNYKDLSPSLREKIIQCLTMLNKKGIILAEELIQTLFPLLTAGSLSPATGTGQNLKALRRQIYSILIVLLKAENAKVKNQKLNRSTQALLFNLLEKNDANGLWATKLTRELWRRGIWDDSRTVEIMTHAALHPEVKVSIAGTRFFLGADKEREENFEESSDEEGFDMNALKHKMKINKKTSRRAKKLEHVVNLMKKKGPKHSATYLNFSAIHLLRDPQGFAEQLYENHLTSKSSNKFNLEQKILFMNLISRMIGTHKLTVLGIYSFFLKYLTPKQRDVTQIMAAAAQATHDLVPPESISTVVRKIADEFVSEGVAAEVAAAGINTIREILARSPLAIDTPLLQDLTQYKGSKSKPVMMAARSLISLYREVAPEMLLKKDRGKVASMELQSGVKRSLPQFGVESSTTTTIPGIELLAKWRKEQGLSDNEEEDEEAWEVDEDSDEEVSDDDWVTVESDKEYKLSSSDSSSDSEDENSDDEENSEQPAKKQKQNKAAQSEEKKAEAQDAMTKLLSSRVLTPADFAKLEELKVQAGVEKHLGIRNEEEVDSTSLLGDVKYKQEKEERIAHAQEGKEDRHFGSKKGKREKPHSTTNKEKARKKNFVMMVHKKSVQGKKKLSLRDRQRVLRAHITKQKKKGY